MRRNHKTPASRAMIDSLESRTHFSASLARLVEPDSHPVSPATVTKLTVQSGAIGQPVTFTATVRDAASLGSPTGTVNLIDHGNVIYTITLAPIASSSAKYDYSSGTYTIAAGAGGAAYYFGGHVVSALYDSSGALRASHTSAHFRIAMPKYTVYSGGLKVASVQAGSGPAIAVGQTAAMYYTGYLYSNGSIFDDSQNDGGTPLPFVVGANPEQVITGFDVATVGMEVGETRVAVIPAALGYGSLGSPPAIPPNAKLVFLITLEGIS